MHIVDDGCEHAQKGSRKSVFAGVGGRGRDAPRLVVGRGDVSFERVWITVVMMRLLRPAPRSSECHIKGLELALLDGSATRRITSPGGVGVEGMSPFCIESLHAFRHLMMGPPPSLCQSE